MLIIGSLQNTEGSHSTWIAEKDVTIPAKCNTVHAVHAQPQLCLRSMRSLWLVMISIEIVKWTSRCSKCVDGVRWELRWRRWWWRCWIALGLECFSAGSSWFYVTVKAPYLPGPRWSTALWFPPPPPLPNLIPTILCLRQISEMKVWKTLGVGSAGVERPPNAFAGLSAWGR